MYQMGKIFDAANYSTINVVPSMIVLNNATREFGSLRDHAYRIAINTDHAKIAEIEGGIRNAQAGLEKAFKGYEVDGCGGISCITDDKDKGMLTADKEAYAAYLRTLTDILDASRNLESGRAVMLLAKNVTLADTLNRDLSDHMQYNVDISAKAAADANSVKSSATWISMSLGSLILVFVVTMGLWIVRILVRSLNDAVNAATRISEGDLSGTILAQGNDETARLLKAMRTMQDNLCKLIGEIKASTDTIATASKEIASGNSDLSQRTEEQASSLEETASSMEELTSTVKQNTENAKQANQLAISASDVAGKGGDDFRH
jgi:methyl-accepting chemotaxis protein